MTEKLRLRAATASTSTERQAVNLVPLGRHILEVIRAVVQLVQVFVIDLKSGGARADESRRDEHVHIADDLRPVFSEDTDTAVGEASATQHPSPRCATSSGFTSDSALRRGAVIRKSGDGPPLLAREIAKERRGRIGRWAETAGAYAPELVRPPAALTERHVPRDAAASVVDRPNMAAATEARCRLLRAAATTCVHSMHRRSEEVCL